MDLMGPMRTESLGDKKYILVMVDDYSRYAWVAFLRDKSEKFINFKDIGLKFQNEKKCIPLKGLRVIGRENLIILIFENFVIF